MIRSLLLVVCAGLAFPAQAADLFQIPGIVAGGKARGADWKAAAKLEKIVQAAAKTAGHNLTALGGDAGKKALACKGNVDCLAKIASGNSGYAVVVVVWALKNKQLGEVALFDLSSMKKIGGANGRIDDKLGSALVAAIPAPAEPEPEPEPEAPAEPAAQAATEPGAEAAAGDEKTEVTVVPPETTAEAPAVAAAAPSASSNKNLSYALIGGGVAMIGGGAYFGLAALDLHDQLTQPLAADVREDKVGEMKQSALMSDVLMFPGIIAAGAGAYLLMLK
jgi:hypothetical protein